MRPFLLCLGAVALVSSLLASQTPLPASEYRIYAGNTHAHTAVTWSHGAHLATNGCAGILTYAPDPASGADVWSDGYVRADGTCPAIFVINGAQIHAPGVTVKSDWMSFQGPPAAHFAAAKAAGLDFYAATDHSQEAGLQPTDQGNPQWVEVQQQATAATDDGFTALAGFEFSENDGPGGTGHINVINSADIINALALGVDLPYFYRWLAAAKPNGAGPVVATFNHPGPEQYANWTSRDPAVTDVLTMLEVINSNNKIYEEGFVNALDRGWKVAPVTGNDNHGLGGIATQSSRTFVLASDGTKPGILEAMQHRRTYASLETNIQARYTVNGVVMGSTLERPRALPVRHCGVRPGHGRCAGPHHQGRHRLGWRQRGGHPHTRAGPCDSLDADRRRRHGHVLFRPRLERRWRRCARSGSREASRMAGARLDRPVALTEPRWYRRRVLTRDDARQVAAAETFVAGGAWVPNLAVAEATWGLESVYARSRAAIATAVDMLLSHQHLTVQEAETVAAAVARFRGQPKVGFSDCLMVEIARKAGHLPLGTFDRHLGKVDGGVSIGRWGWRPRPQSPGEVALGRPAPTPLSPFPLICISGV